MKKIIAVVLLTAFVFSFCIPCSALGLSAYSAVLIEADSGRVIFEKNASERLSMASTTKIMTALCAVENAQLDKRIAVDNSAVGVEGSSIYLKKGEHLTIRELVYGLMLNSGNDAAVAIACAVSGSVDKFAALMNSTAEKIGVENTHFMNPNGLDEEGHYTTAFDLARITAYAMKNDEFRKIVSTYETTIPYEGYSYNRRLRNHNRLLKLYDGCIGVKTGFTKKSGRCLVSAANRGGVTLIAVTLKAPDDWNDHMAMLNYGFERTKRVSVLKKGAYLKTIAVSGGTLQTVGAVLEEPIDICEISGAQNRVTLKYKLAKKLKAPVGYKQNAGTVEVYLNGVYLKSVNAVTDTVIKKDTRKTLKRSAGLIWSEFIGLRLPA